MAKGKNPRLGVANRRQADNPNRDAIEQRAANRKAHAERLSVNAQERSRKSGSSMGERMQTSMDAADSVSANARRQPTRDDVAAVEMLAQARAHNQTANDNNAANKQRNRSEAAKKAWRTRKRGGG